MVLPTDEIIGNARDALLQADNREYDNQTEPEYVGNAEG